MRIATSLACLTMALALPARAAGLPPDAAVNPAAPNKTLEPNVVANSGRLEWVPFKRDLTDWPTLSHEDKRSTAKPRKVKLSQPLNGDPARGREIAQRSDKGYCIVCHQMPGEDWPTTVFTSITVGWVICRREKASNCWVRAAARAAVSLISSTSARRGSPSSKARRSKSE